MNLSVGIVGLPNVGKSTLFNALLKKQQALAANYPFATIEPNVGVVPVPDERLEELAKVVSLDLNKETPLVAEASSRSHLGKPPVVPATVRFVDIAGLVKGASEGAGLGNRFLSHIREVAIIAHVVRDFEDPDVIREGSVTPRDDYETIHTELILADLQTLSNVNDKTLKTDSIKKSAVEKLKSAFDSGKSATDVELTDEEQATTKELGLLSGKPEVVVINVAEGEYTTENIPSIVKKHADSLSLPQDRFVVICAKIESELSDLSEEDQKVYLKDLGLTQSGLERLIEKAYERLGLISFLTAGEKEVRAWTVQKKTKAVDAAGVIHTDFSKNFIKAEVVSFDDFVSAPGWKKSREFGKARLEGKDYVVKDGDVVEFKIGS